jgi:hypothetical protein
MEERNLKLAGDIVGKALRINYDFGDDSRIYEVWLPIESPEKESLDPVKLIEKEQAWHIFQKNVVTQRIRVWS